MTDKHAPKSATPQPAAHAPRAAAPQGDDAGSMLPDTVKQPLVNLGKRIDRLEKLLRDNSAGTTFITGSLEAQAPLFLQVKDSVDRVETTAEAIPQIKDALDRVEQDSRQRYDVAQATAAELFARLETSQALAGTLTARLEKLESLIEPLIAHIKVALPSPEEIEKSASNPETSSKILGFGFGPSLIDRLNRVEGAVVLLAESRYVLARVETTAMLLGPIKDAIDRVELASSQRYDVASGALNTIVQRLDRLEQSAGRSGPVLDGIARIELASQQRHEANTAISQAIAERLDRIEAGDTERREWQQRLTNRMLDLAARNGNGHGRPAADAETPLFALSAEDSEGLEHRLTGAPEYPIPDALARFLAGIASAKGRLQDDSGASSALQAAQDLAASAAGARNRQRLTAGTRLIWILPGTTSADCPNDDELIQTFGILATGIGVHRSVGAAGLTVVTGMRKLEAAMPILRWDGAEAAERTLKRFLAAVPEATRKRLRPAIRLAGLGRAEARSWAQQTVKALTKAFGPHLAVDWGVIWPNEALTTAEPYLLCLNALKDSAQEGGHAVTFQWVEGLVPVSRSGDVLRLAHTAGVLLDLTPTASDLAGSALMAYDSARPYQPMGFDLRIPSFAAAPQGTMALTCMARRESVVEQAGADPFAPWTRTIADRLAQVFDRKARANFMAWLNRGNNQAGQWERFYVYNWRPPLDALCLAPVLDPLPTLDEVDIRAIADSIGKLGDIGVSDLVALGLSSAETDSGNNLKLQIDAHDYLVNRTKPSPDSAHLLDWLPAHMGQTLELGSGYGVLARHFIDRTDGYVGVDLTLAQGRAIAELGGAPLVADIHTLPFSDAAFDTIVADNVIEHALEPVKALSEIARLLRPGGSAFLLLPLDYLGRDYRNPSHQWKADERSIREALKAAGLTIRRSEVALLSQFGTDGSFPSCGQRTSFWDVTPAVQREPARTADTAERVTIDLATDMAAVDAAWTRTASAVAEEIIALNKQSDLDPLAKNSPALRGFDWSSYIRFSGARIVRTLRALRASGIKGRVLDMGAYFGNFSLALRRAGWNPVALDSYAIYGNAFALHRALMEKEGIDIRDYADVGYDLAGLEAGSFDAVICMGVIEHIPHTPRMLLASIMRALKPGGVVVLDTPNLGYEYQRHKLMAGNTVFAPIETQFETDIPFEGHHREYLPGEIRWMLQRSGFEAVEIETFNYSVYGLAYLEGENLTRFRAMERDPDRRELILASARKPA